ncbi:MAG: LPS export ABC transporter permease LptG [Gammaproteobacteria bacterium]|nr:LPS export ABC transporter permease LptG [Gammaproteobacteria bacterium]
MKLINRYVSSSILQMTLLVFFMLVGLELFITFIAQLDDLGKGNYNLWQAILYVPLTLPINVYDLFPMAGLLGSLLGLGNLATHSELIVMRASGVTLSQIAKTTLQTALIMWIGMFFIGEVIGPPAMHLAETNKKIAQTAGQALKTESGFWLRDGETFIHVQNILPGRRLQDVSLYQFDPENELASISRAKEAFYRNQTWWLSQITQSNIKNNTITTKNIELEKWPVKLHTELFNMSNIEPAELTLPKLHQLIEYRKENGLRTSNEALIFWQRIFQPLATCVMIFLAIPFIFGPLRTVTIGLRIVTGVLVGFVFYLTNQFFGPLSLVYQFPPILGAALPSLLFLGGGLFLMKKTK